MDLLPTEEQEEIVATVRAQLERDFDLHQLAAHDGSASVVDRDLWRRCAELGWFGLGLTEALGGVGYTLAEEALLFEQLGAHATPGPFLATVLGARLAALSGHAELTLSIRTARRCGARRTARRRGGDRGEHVQGTFRVTDHGDADLVLVMAGDDASLVDADHVTAEPIRSLDQLVPIAVGTLSGPPVRCHLEGAASLWQRATVLVAAELAGIARATAEQSTQYAKDREQFGPIGSGGEAPLCRHGGAEAATTLVRYARGARRAARRVVPRPPARAVGERRVTTHQRPEPRRHRVTWEPPPRSRGAARVQSRTLGDALAPTELLEQPAP